jgi:hypothetical protein
LSSARSIFGSNGSRPTNLGRSAARRVLDVEALEAEGFAVVRRRPHHVLRHPVGDFGLDLQGHLDHRAEQGGEVLGDGFGDIAGAPAWPGPGQLDRAVESPGPGRVSLTLPVEEAGLIDRPLPR